MKTFSTKASVLKWHCDIMMFEERRQNCPQANTHPQFLGELAKDPATASWGLQMTGESRSLAVPQGAQGNQHRK